MKNVLITGASTGIGYDAARELVAHGYQVFGSVRKMADAERLKAAFGEPFTPLVFDVTDSAGVKTAVSTLKQQIGSVGLAALVNNAGIAVPGPVMYLPPDEFRRQFEVNLFGLLDVTQACLPLLGAVKNAPYPPGRIINISSVSGRITYPFMAPYSASKHALEALSDAMRRELLIYGIDVVVIEPGSVKTPIWDKADQLDVSPYAHTDYAPILAAMQKLFVRQGQTGLPVELVSRTIREAIEAKRPKTRYVLARKYLSGWLIPRLLPDRWLDRIMANRLGLVNK